jgi:hypothetical protein
MAAGLRSAIERRAELLAAAPAARELQETRWRQQLETLSARLTRKAT